MPVGMLFGACRGGVAHQQQSGRLFSGLGAYRQSDGNFLVSPTGSSMPARQNLGPDVDPTGCRGSERPPRHVEVGVGEVRALCDATALNSVQVGVAHPCRQCGVLRQVPHSYYNDDQDT
ncbi:hypothetical protein NDU88_009963 [Pleurodeles waltl]|uniref:Uncharacterized protein n=1 Tax=Pleurodeles waltl TaxID=8319 RepID=A0AAV7S2J1_PLEWA|nr:hypothetical protein NDU88_009963 [Pleurodeles waltl]